MPIGINTNLPSLSAQRGLNSAQENQNRNFANLSSGSKINSAKDDAAGLAIATQIYSELQGLRVAERNASDGISLAQVAEGAFDEANSILQRQRELALQAANGSNTPADREVLQQEFNSLQQQLNDIASNTSFNGVSLFGNGQDLSIDFQIGSSADQTVNVEIQDPLSGTGGLDISTQAGAQAAITAIDEVISQVASSQSNLGAVQSRFESATRSLQSQAENQAAARSRITDTDFAQESADLVKNQILSQVGIAVLAQANVSQQNTLSLLSQ